jgi:hypothetical protein
MKQLGYFLLQHIVWLDSGFGQFKSLKTWFFVGYPSLFLWNPTFKLPIDLQLFCFKSWEGGSGWCKNNI